MILDSSMVEHTAVNRGVVGSSPTRGGRRSGSDFGKQLRKYDRNSGRIFGIKTRVVRTPGEQGSMVKRLRHRPFTAVTRVRFPLESLFDGFNLFIGFALSDSNDPQGFADL